MIDDRVTIISSSWAYCEDQTTLADAEGLTRCFRMPQWWESACSTAPGTAGARAWTAPQTRSQSLLIHSMPRLLEEVLRTPAHPSVQSLPGVSPRLAVESTSGAIGRITFGAKRTGKRSAGNPRGRCGALGSRAERRTAAGALLILFGLPQVLFVRLSIDVHLGLLGQGLLQPARRIFPRRASMWPAVSRVWSFDARLRS
jgi:hypothetical protein